MIREARSRFRQRHRNIKPRLEHPGMVYYITRAFAAGFLRELTTYTVVGDIIAGDKDVVYSTFLGYDEVAHHCGVSDDESFYVLQTLDKCIKRIEGAKAYAQRPYYICVLSDHGQTGGATFKQRYGYTLAQLVQKLVPEDHRTYSDLNSNQDHFGQIVTVPLENVRKPLENVTKPSTRKRAKRDEEKADVIVLASGNMGLIYFTRWTERISAEDIENHYPGVIEGLSRHEGISFIMVRSKEAEGVIMGAGGKRYLKDDRIEGEDPLAKFGKQTAEHLRRTDSFDCVPDIMLVSMYDTEKDEVAAFEELIGSHGGIGGNQTKPFILHPAEWNIGEEEIIGAESVGRLFSQQIKVVY
ncbi:MAG: alkaline phosphatase family protein [Dehalococcoidales bacterium]|nr:alkaline phosphatase family protein [Dehalococcoidales bacterium]